DDLAGFLDDALVESALDRDRPLELPPRAGVYYKAYTDASGGAVAGDLYALAIGHREHGIYTVDVVKARQGPFDPVELTKTYAQVCKEYRCLSVVGDLYGREWVGSAWRNAGIAYAPSQLTASEQYLEAFPLFARGLVRLPPDDALARELRLLERMPTRMGKDVVVHPRGTHDDRANVAC